MTGSLCHGTWSRMMAFSMTSSLRMTATRATFLGLPLSHRCVESSSPNLMGLGSFALGRQAALAARADSSPGGAVPTGVPLRSRSRRVTSRKCMYNEISVSYMRARMLRAALVSASNTTPSRP